jgi:hypothetical protein
MKNDIYSQLARNTGLLPDDIAAAILAGNTPAIKEIVIALLIGAMDAHAVTIGDPQSTWNEKRLAHMALAVAFLSAMAVAGDDARQGGER